MVDVAQLSIKVDTTDLARGEASLEALQREGKQTETTMARLGTTAQKTGSNVRTLNTGVNAAGTASRRFGSQIQNASFQVGDFAVQVAGGTSAVRAMTQQLPQLLGVFGVMGAVFGAVAAIGGALIPVLFNLGKGAETFGETLEELQGSLSFTGREIEALKKLQQDYVAATVRGQDDIAASLATEIQYRSQLLEFRKIEQEQQIRALQKAVEESKQSVDEVFSAARQAASSIEQDAINAQFTRTQAQSAALEAVQRELDANRDIIIEYKKQTAELGLAETQMDSINRLLTEAAGGAANLASGMADVANEALKAALSVQQIFDRENKQYGGRGGDPRNLDASSLGGSGIDAMIANANRKPGGGGGGSSPADTFASDLDNLRKRLRSEQEVALEVYEENLAILQDQRAKEILGEEAHRDALLDVERDYQDKMRAIRIAKQDETLGYTSSFFGAMAQATAAGGDKLVKASRVFGAVEATINAYRAAAQVLADPSVPFWGKAAAYASILATGLGAVQAIKGAGGGGGGSSAAAQTAQTSNTSSRVALTLVGSENAMFSKQQVRDLINQINEATEDGAIVRLA